MKKSRRPAWILLFLLLGSLLIVVNGQLSFGGNKQILLHGLKSIAQKEAINLEGSIDLAPANEKKAINGQMLPSLLFDGEINFSSQTTNFKFYLSGEMHEDKFELGTFHQEAETAYIEMVKGGRIDLPKVYLGKEGDVTFITTWMTWLDEAYALDRVVVTHPIVADSRTGYKHLKIRTTCYSLDITDLLNDYMQTQSIPFLEEKEALELVRLDIYVNGLGEINQIKLYGNLGEESIEVAIRIKEC